MQRIPVDSARLDLMALQVLPDNDGDGDQKTNPDGVPLWKVETLVRPKNGARATVELVKVAVKAAPTISGPCRFVGLTARPWVMGDRNGVTLIADAVEALGARGEGS